MMTATTTSTDTHRDRDLLRVEVAVGDHRHRRADEHRGREEHDPPAVHARLGRRSGAAPTCRDDGWSTAAATSAYADRVQRVEPGGPALAEPDAEVPRASAPQHHRVGRAEQHERDAAPSRREREPDDPDEQQRVEERVEREHEAVDRVEATTRRARRARPTRSSSATIANTAAVEEPVARVLARRGRGRAGSGRRRSGRSPPGRPRRTTTRARPGRRRPRASPPITSSTSPAPMSNHAVVGRGRLRWSPYAKPPIASDARGAHAAVDRGARRGARRCRSDDHDVATRPKERRALHRRRRRTGSTHRLAYRHVRGPDEATRRSPRPELPALVSAAGGGPGAVPGARGRGGS